MASKATFNPNTKVISITSAPVLEGAEWVIDFNVKEHLYSEGKEDWVVTESLRKFAFPVRAIGGDDLPGSKQLGTTFFLNSDWKIKPYESTHRFRVNGNLYSEDGTSPFIPTTGTYQVFLEQQVSSLVDSTVQQLKEIEQGSFENSVHVDQANGVAGTDYNIGTPANPVNNLADAKAIALFRGFYRISFLGPVNLPADINLTNFILVGQNANLTQISVPDGADVTNCEFSEAFVSGTLDGGCIIRHSMIMNLSYINGVIFETMLAGGTISLGGGQTAHFLDCYTGSPAIPPPTIDMNGTGNSLSMQGYRGEVHISNKTGPEKVNINLDPGIVILENDVTGGTITVNGVGELVDASGNEILTGSWNGCTIVNKTVSGSFLQKILRFIRRMVGGL